MTNAQMPVLAVDIGGTKVAVAAVTADGKVLRRAEATTPATDDAERLFTVVADLVAELSHDRFAVREAASRELAEWDADIGPALREARPVLDARITVRGISRTDPEHNGWKEIHPVESWVAAP